MHTCRGDLKKLEFIYKKLCIYSYMFKLQSPWRYSPFGAVHLSRHFFPLLKSFWTYQFWWLLVLLLFFVSLLPYHKMFPFEDFFHLGKQKKVTQGKIWWIGRLGRGEHAIFCQKLLNTQRGMSRCTSKSSIMKGANVLKESSEKKNHWSQMQPLTITPASALIQVGS